MIIRQKQLKDCEAWIDVNIRGWTENLKGVVSDALLKSIEDRREIRLKTDTENFQTDDFNWVLEKDGKVTGILKIKMSEIEGYENCAEIQILYLEKNEKGKGYGKALINKGFEVLKEKGYEKAVISCIDGNPSNGFYEHIGCKFIRKDPWNIMGEHYFDNIYEYQL